MIYLFVGRPFPATRTQVPRLHKWGWLVLCWGWDVAWLIAGAQKDGYVLSNRIFHPGTYRQMMPARLMDCTSRWQPLGISLLQPYNESRGKNIRHKLLLLFSSTLSMKTFEKYAVKKKKSSSLFYGSFCYADHHFQTYRKLTKGSFKNIIYLRCQEGLKLLWMKLLSVYLSQIIIITGAF